MPDIRIIKGIQIQPDERTALKLAGYTEGTPSWDDGAALFQSLLPLLRRSIQPKGAVGFAADGRKAFGAAVVLTLGGVVGRQLDRFTRDHELPKELLFSTMADSCLFALEKQVMAQLRQICQQKGIGLSARHESGVDALLETMAEAVTMTAAQRTLQVQVTKDFVLLPEKSMVLLFDVTDDASVFHVDHSCASCTKTDCALRQDEAALEVACPAGEEVLTYIQDQGLPLAAPCGGKGVCGKCKVRVLSGTLPVTVEDKEFFTDAELADGWRLACQAKTTEDVTVEVPAHDESSFAALGTTDGAVEKKKIPLDHETGIAIDIGSTTLAASLVDMTTKEVLHTETAVNQQRRFGADVISRIQAANTGQAEALHDSIREDIASLCVRLAQVYPSLPRTYGHLMIAGNTTMEHLFMGYSCEGLGSWPFHPVTLGGETVKAQDAMGDVGVPWLTNQPVTLLPGISTFVGADITAGIWKCGMTTSDELTLLLDLGTNGEMAVGNTKGLIVASTAAGPALEGGNLSCGTGSVSGAISGVSIHHGKAVTKTIDNAAPVGICGTGVIECVAALVEQGLVDSTGKLKEPYFTNGFYLGQTPDGKDIRVTQQDIREIQMAKGAIRAGLETLLATYGATYDDVTRVYLAGGFGYYLNPEKAAAMGLLPKELAPKTTAVGNTSLAGAIGALIEPTALADMKGIQQMAKEVVLGNTPKFQELYITHMGF